MDGALAFAFPTHFGQDLIIQKGDHRGLVWKSYNHKGDLWFEGLFDIPTGQYNEGTDEDVGHRLEQMFKYISSQKNNFLKNKDGIIIETHLDFPNNWGLGSSSTLIHCLAQWADVNSFQLLKHTMGGSGYDIACAGSDSPILYQIQNNAPIVKSIDFNPPFKDHLFFIYLEEKQNSRTGIKYYRQQTQDKLNSQIINNISIITQRMLNTTSLNEFQHLVKQHEHLISSHLNLPKVKEERFSDFWGEIKSLGAWGGDFILATSSKTYIETKEYFSEKGYHTFFSFDEIIYSY